MISHGGGANPIAKKLRQGNVFTPVCQSFHSQGGVSGWIPKAQPRYSLAYMTQSDVELRASIAHFEMWLSVTVRLSEQLVQKINRETRIELGWS